MEEKKKCNCELNWRNEKAVYVQNIELLGMEIKELREKEKNYKGFNDQLLNQYNQIHQHQQNSKLYKHIQQNVEQHTREIIDIKAKYEDIIIELRKEVFIDFSQIKKNSQLKTLNEQLENQLKINTENYEKEIQRLQNPQKQEIQIKESVKECVKENMREKVDTLLDEDQQSRRSTKEFATLQNSTGQTQNDIRFENKISKFEQQQEKENKPPNDFRRINVSKNNQEIQKTNQNVNNQQKQMGCIVYVNKNNRSKSILEKKKSPQLHQNVTVNQLQNQAEKFNQKQNTESDYESLNQKKRVSDSPNSSFFNISHITCKQSNFLEIQPQMRQSNLVTQFDLNSKSPENLRNMLEELHKEKNEVEEKISQYVRSPKGFYSDTNSQLLQKSSIEDIRQSKQQQNEQKGKINEIYSISKSKGSLSCDKQHQTQSISQSRVSERPLDAFTRKLNQIKSIEDFGQISRPQERPLDNFSKQLSSLKSMEEMTFKLYK